MTEVTAPDLTPPVKGAKPPKAAKEPKAPKVAKEPKAPKEPKVAKPKGTYVKDKNATISVLVTAEEAKYHGQRGDWFARVKASEGKTVAEFTEANKGLTNGKGNPESPTGWLRFFVIEGTVALNSVAAVAEAPAAAEAVVPTVQ